MASAIPQHLPRSAMEVTYSPSFAAGAAGAAGPAPQQMTAAMLNSFFLSAMADRLSDHFEHGVRSDELSELCLPLARGIDYALTINDVPVVAHRLPSLVKKVYQQRYGTSHQVESAITLVMISVKNACKNGWFPATDTAELLNMANELCSSFCMAGSVTAETSNALYTISMIIPRFYPQLRLCRLIASFEAKMLFIAQKDNVETSSCLISPPQVSFLVNGTGVERRNIVSLDAGPQFPTNITKMLKYGANIIQAVGYFSSNYIIAIAFMSKIHPSARVLNDYVQPVVAALASDSEIIEGPSRISLNCPVSCRRIKTPVKGYLCKHHQCFDYENFLEMNLRKPSWRCPCCNQSVSFIDLRIDQKMVKILSEVGDNNEEIILSADGSWKVAEHNCSVDLTMGEESEDSGRDASMCYRTVENLDGSSNRFDNDPCETEDRKPFKSDQSFPTIQISSEPLLTIDTPVISQGSLISTASVDTQRVGTLESLIPNFVLNPQITSPALYREPIASHGASQPTFPLQNISHAQQLAEIIQLQRSRIRNSIISNETNMPRIPRNANGAPAAVQVLPMQTQQASNFSQWTLTNMSGSNILSGSPSASYQSISSMTAIQDGFCTNRDHQDRRYILKPASQQAAGVPAITQLSTRAPPDQQRGAGAYRAIPLPPDHLNPHHLLPNRWAPQPMSQCTIQQPPRNAADISVETLVNIQNHLLSARHAASRTGSSFWATADGYRQTESDPLLNMGCGATGFDGVSDFLSEQSWQPTGRMRGSVTGSAYSAAFGYYQARPVGNVPASSSMPSIVPSASDLYSVQFANIVNGQRSLT